MFSILKKNSTETLHQPNSNFLHLVIAEDGTIVVANKPFVDLVQTITNKKINHKGMVGKKASEVFGENYSNSIVGTFMKDKKPFSNMFLIGNQTYQVVAEEVTMDNNIYYEFFYFPIQQVEKYLNEHTFQKIAYEIALKKGFKDVDWIMSLSDNHCQQLIYCLNKHDHSATPNNYCIYGHKCGFNPNCGWLQLDRRSFYRAPVELRGEVYLLALKDRIIPANFKDKKISCTALDLSMSGIKLKLNVCLPIDSEIRIVFEDFTCEGTVAWTKKQDEGCFTGIKFSPLNPEQHNNIMKVYTKAQGAPKIVCGVFQRNFKTM